MDADELARKEELNDLRRNGEVLLTHPALPDQVVGAMPESVPRMLANGWELHESEPAEAEADGTVVATGEAVKVEEVEMPAGNASAEVWRNYAETVHYASGRDDFDFSAYSRDELRDHYLNDTPLPDKDE